MFPTFSSLTWKKSSWFYSVIVLFTVRCVDWLTKESISCVCVVKKLLVCWKRRRQFGKKHSSPFLNCFLLTNVDAAVLFEGRRLSLFTFVCGISVTEQPLLLGFSCCWKELCDQTLSQPSSPSNAVANIVKINKQKKPKQTNRQGFATANSTTSVLFTFPTEYFYRDFSGSLSYQLWHQLQCISLSVSDCTGQINSLSRSWGTIQGIFLDHLYCNPAH